MPDKPTPSRCAVYTRKSTEDGLDQEFNSLDAQREACCAYIVSQRHEGWTLVPDHYDDGGFSGGSMQRPGLKRLLDDVAAGKVDTIVIYKVDRLTRSLADFSRIVDVLDQAGASFVSITQAFNTTTSMGRLTLNMLLSFAQFEREVTGERIRDKIAASKRKGIWMGGPVPLGYNVIDRKLVADPAEAELVRHIMRRYVALSSVNELVKELKAQGRRTKVQFRVSGPHRGGISFERGTLFHLLKNRIYLGETVHKGVAYPGEHQAIVDQALWHSVQTALADRASGSSCRNSVPRPSTFAGIISDGLGRPMTPTHARKGGKRYRYYVTRPDQLKDAAAWRVPAYDLEEMVIGRITTMLLDQAFVYDLVDSNFGDAAAVQSAIKHGERTATELGSGSAHARMKLLRTLVTGVMLGDGSMEVEVSRASILNLLNIMLHETGDEPPTIRLTCPTVKVRQGHDVRLVIPGPTREEPVNHVRDEKLVLLLREAHAARALVCGEPGRSINRIAGDAGRCRTRLVRLFSLSHLAPDIVTAILEGRQSHTVTHRRLLEIDLPIDWAAQRAELACE